MKLEIESRTWKNMSLKKMDSRKVLQRTPWRTSMWSRRSSCAPKQQKTLRTKTNFEKMFCTCNSKKMLELLGRSESVNTWTPLYWNPAKPLMCAETKEHLRTKIAPRKCAPTRKADAPFRPEGIRMFSLTGRAAKLCLQVRTAMRKKMFFFFLCFRAEGKIGYDKKCRKDRHARNLHYM
jgi:hypothetical protein